ncbi:PX domain-containing protein [Clostridium culturomicium]|uniref:hypothetical protein n=1 Tax=Clostridium culturomicium TaxID=1499683 RepID=UPI0038575C9B
MLNEIKQRLVEEYVNKGKTGKSNKSIAQELGISERTLFRYLQEDEVKRAINKSIANSIDSLLPQLINNAETMIHSSNPSEKAKGNDLAIQLMQKVKVKEELSVLEREKSLIEKFIESCVTHSSFLKDIDSRLFLEVCVSQFTEAILLKGYEKPPMTRREIEEFIEEAQKNKVTDI